MEQVGGGDKPYIALSDLEAKTPGSQGSGD